jgi:hypothetical protein
MASEVGSSFLEPEATLDSASSTTKSRGKAALSTWAHARQAKSNEPTLNPDGHPLLYCVHCPEATAYNSHVTTNFRKHLLAKHKIKVDISQSKLKTDILSQLQQLLLDAEVSDQIEEVTTEIMKSILHRQLINEALVSLIATRNLSFRILEWPEFHTFCRLLNPQSKDFLHTAHSTVPRLIEKSFTARKDLIRKKLQSALSSIHLSLDIWTSPNRHLLLGVCAHFVDCSQETLSKALLGLQSVPGHSGQDQFDILLPLLEDYGIVQKLGCIIGDNASTNDTLCKAISRHLSNEEIEWNPSFRRIRCLGHIINLAVQAFLFQGIDIGKEEEEDREEGEDETTEEKEKKRQARFRKMGSLGKLHNIVVHIRSPSSGHAKEFKKLAGRMISLDNRTRWNSWYNMLVIADKTAAAVDSYTKNYLPKLQQDYLSPADWVELRKILDFLHPCYRATMATQGDNATLDRVLVTMDILIHIFKDALVGNFSLVIMKYLLI